jgi:hypothetical protein
MKLRFLTILLPLCGCATAPPPQPSLPHPPYTFVLDGSVLRLATPEERTATTRPSEDDILEGANRRDMAGGRYADLLRTAHRSSR